MQASLYPGTEPKLLLAFASLSSQMLEPMMEDPPVAIKHRRHQRVMNALWKLRRELLLGL